MSNDLADKLTDPIIRSAFEQEWIQQEKQFLNLVRQYFLAEENYSNHYRFCMPPGPQDNAWKDWTKKAVELRDIRSRAFEALRECLY